MNIQDIARICHEANRAYCKVHGNHSQVYWDKADEWQRRSAVVGVQFRLENPTGTTESQHSSWLESKQKEGWTYGPKYDAKAKTHPCMVPYKDLPTFQQAKDALFVGIVDALAPYLNKPAAAAAAA